MEGLIFLLPRVRVLANRVRSTALQYPNKQRISWALRAYPKGPRQAHARVSAISCLAQIS